MGVMADWTDGPEYAPRDRPDAFEAPDAAPLASVAAAPAVAPIAAAAVPTAPGTPTFGEPAAAPPLDRLAAAGLPPRDPAAPFALVATPLTAADRPAARPPSAPLRLSTQAGASDAPGAAPGAPPPGQWEPPDGPSAWAPIPHASPWGAAHAPQSAPRVHDDWTPWQPLALPDAPVGSPAGQPAHPQAPVNPPPFPPPDADHWYAGYGQAPAPVSPPVTVRALVDAIHPAVVACVAAGALAPWFGLGLLSAPLLVVALLLAVRLTRYRRGAVRTLFLVVGGGSLLLGALAALDSYAPLLMAFWEGWSDWANLACWVLLVALPLMVGGALRRGEPPEIW